MNETDRREGCADERDGQTRGMRRRDGRTDGKDGQRQCDRRYSHSALLKHKPYDTPVYAGNGGRYSLRRQAANCRHAASSLYQHYQFMQKLLRLRYIPWRAKLVDNNQQQGVRATSSCALGRHRCLNVRCVVSREDMDVLTF